MEKDLKVETIIRHGEPSKLDHAEYNTRCQVLHGQEYDLYIQTSKNEEDPMWDFIGTFDLEDE